MRSVDDLTARSRIRDAALARFGRDGVDRTSLRSIAKDAGVSAPLVLHHFGSKDGLRQACDERVFALVQEKLQIGEREPDSAGLAALTDLMREAEPLQAYIARSLTDGSEHAAALFDQLVAASESYLERGEARGEIRPGADRRGRAVMLVSWAMSFLVLGDHMARAIGAKTLDRAGQLRLGASVIEIYTSGFYADDRWASVVDKLSAQEGA
ncbi:MAG TPA: TetR family transcriptional regulator [Mycobacteriales bacterium]|jgi:AcrR family transcriptional regulator|nr:TetR family transcriptional regulator [Mycobacteriales bacterium]